MELELQARADSELDVITGIVVDAEGQAIPGAELSAFGPMLWPCPSAKTNPKGEFYLHCERQPGHDEHCEVTVRKRGFILRTLPRVRWNTRDLRVTLDRGVDTTMLVRDRDTGQPIERYGIRFCARAVRSGEAVQGILVERTQDRGEHPGGKLQLVGLVPGEHALIVEPETEEYSPNPLHRFRVEEGVGSVVEVFLAPPGVLDVIVRGPDSRPLAGTKIELLQTVTMEAPGVGTLITSVVRSGSASGRHVALLIDNAVSDDSGRARLRAPRHAPLFVRCSSDTHRSKVLGPMTLRERSRELIMGLEKGSKLIGTIRPLESLTELGAHSSVRHGRPYLRLWRGDTGFPSLLARYDIAEDGSFEICGLGAGELQLVLCWPDGRDEIIARIEGLTTGEERKLELELSHLVPATLTGRVRIDGVPANGMEIFLRGYDEEPGGPPFLTTVAQATVAIDGSYRLRAKAGEYVPLLRHPGRPQMGRLSAAGPVHLLPGKSEEKNIEIVSGRLAVRLLGANDAPVESAALYLRSPQHDFSARLPETDSSGVSVSEPCSVPQDFELWLVPKPLTGPGAWERWCQQHPGERDRFRAYLKLGTVHIRPGKPEPFTFEVPAAAGY